MIAQITAIRQNHAKKISGRIRNKRNISFGLLNPSTPYFERNSFINEEVSMEELSVIHDLGFTKMTEEDLLETKVAINVIGYSPATKLVNLFAENDILGFARPGVDKHPHLRFLAGLLPRFKKECKATHIALALPKSLQRLLDVFLITGEILPNLSPVNLLDYGLRGDNDFIAVLKAARLAGYKLLAVDPDTPIRPFEVQRERLVASAVKEVMQRDNQAKIIYIAPDRHLGFASIGEWMPVVGILKGEGLSVATVNQYWHADFIPQVFACLLQRLNQPVAIAAKDVKMFAALQSRSLSLEHFLPNSCDLTVIYPRNSINCKNIFKQAILDLGRLINIRILF